VSIPVTDFLALTLSEIRVVRGGGSPQPASQDLALSVCNELLDFWAATDRALFSVDFTTYTLTPSLQPHTIGPTGTFVVSRRPVAILDANLVLANNITSDLTLRDRVWWGDLTNPTLSSTIPTDLYYEPSWPLGKLNLWPVPLTAYGIMLETRSELSNLAIGDTFNLPQGYQLALRMTLAEMLAPHFNQAFTPDQTRRARDARAQVWGNNDQIPPLNTRDAGMPSGSRGCTYDYRTGMSR
jgi:hypothetical protein